MPVRISFLLKKPTVLFYCLKENVIFQTEKDAYLDPVVGT